MSAPLVSIVIANYNYGCFIEQAIESVLSQSCKDYELIICDAESTDDSVSIIRKYETNLSWWCSEKDSGQSNAFNKGFSHAKGRFLTWLNADDVLLPGAIMQLKTAVERYPECQWFIGGALWLDPDMRIVKCCRARPFSEIKYKHGDVGVWGPSSFFSKELLDGIGGVDERFQYMMDVDMWMKFVHWKHARYMRMCNYAWGLRLHSGSKMSGHRFSADGKLVKRKLTDAERWAKQPNVEKQKQRELEMLKIIHPIIPMCMVLRGVLLLSLPALGGILDTIRNKGKYYKDCNLS